MNVLPLNYYPMNGSISSLPNDTVLCKPYSISKEVRFLLMGVNHLNFRSKITCQSSGIEPLSLFICGSSHIQLLLPKLWMTSPMIARVITRLVLKEDCVSTRMIYLKVTVDSNHYSLISHHVGRSISTHFQR